MNSLLRREIFLLNLKPLGLGSGSSRRSISSVPLFSSMSLTLSLQLLVFYQQNTEQFASIHQFVYRQEESKETQ
jgi:hypothetical protein